MKRFFANRERELDGDKAAQAELRLRLLAIDYLHEADGTEAATHCQVIAPLSTGVKRRASEEEAPNLPSDDDISPSSQDDDEPLQFVRPRQASSGEHSKARTLAETKRAQALERGAQLDSQAADRPASDVDDTDGLDPAAERSEWQLRERRRVEREYKEMETAEHETQRRLDARRKRLKNH